MFLFLAWNNSGGMEKNKCRRNILVVGRMGPQMGSWVLDEQMEGTVMVFNSPMEKLKSCTKLKERDNTSSGQFVKKQSSCISKTFPGL